MIRYHVQRKKQRPRSPPPHHSCCLILTSTRPRWSSVRIRTAEFRVQDRESALTARKDTIRGHARKPVVLSTGASSQLFLLTGHKRDDTSRELTLHSTRPPQKPFFSSSHSDVNESSSAAVLPNRPIHQRTLPPNNAISLIRKIGAISEIQKLPSDREKVADNFAPDNLYRHGLVTDSHVQHFLPKRTDRSKNVEDYTCWLPFKSFFSKEQKKEPFFALPPFQDVSFNLWYPLIRYSLESGTLQWFN